MKKTGTVLSIVAALCAIVSSGVGVFFTYGGMPRRVSNIYGQQVTLYGDGLYANDSILKAATTKGTDLVIIIVALLLLVSILFFKDKKAGAVLRTGLLSILLYASTCVAVGVNFNRFFLIYVLQFGSSMFAFISSLKYITNTELYDKRIYEKCMVGTGVFLIISGCSVLAWLMFVLPAILTGRPMETIEIYTTEPTFVIDLGIILPVALFCGIMLIRKKKIGYRLAPVLLTLLTGVGACVAFQTAVQKTVGIHLPTGQFFGLVISFVILGAVAAMLNGRLLHYAR